jgi:glycosyltransferase involved in cell wall biosynthesis
MELRAIPNGRRRGPRPVIAVVVPAFRTEPHIRGVLATIPEFVSLVVVVDDGSPDRTADIVATMRARDPRIVLHRHEHNQGVGAAVLAGYRIAADRGADIIVKMDGDGQMDPAHLARLVDPIVRGRADYAKGNRFLHARELVAMPFVRRVGNLGLSFFTKLASGYWSVFDPTNGYTAIHARALAVLETDRLARRYFFETSMLIELGVAGAVVKDVPMPARYGNEVSSLSVRRVLREFPPRLVRGCLRRIWMQHYLRDFTALAMLASVGLVLAACGTAWGAAWWIASSRSGVTASTGTVMLAVLPLILGVQCLLHALLLDLQNEPRRPLHREAAEAVELAARYDEGPDAETVSGQAEGRRAA